MKLTDYQREIMESVKGGADVWEYGIANACRLLEQKGLVEICPAMNAPEDRARRQPYFGCIATAAGLEALNAG